MWLLLQGVFKPANLVLIPGGAGFILYLLLQATWEPRHTSDLFHGTRRVSSGKGISEAAANILTLSINVTTSCKISRLLIFFLPIFFSHVDETLAERFPTPSNPTAKFLDCGGVIIPAPFPTPSLNSPKSLTNLPHIATEPSTIWIWFAPALRFRQILNKQ